MAKKKNIFGNRRKKNAEHLARTEGFVRKVQQLFDLFCKKTAKIALSTDFNPEKEFKWADFPAIQQRINTLTSDWAKSLNLTITSGIKQEWDEANHSHDIALKQFFDAHTYTTQTKKGVRKYFEYNKDAVTNFIERKNKGLSLSENLWNLRDGFKDELESAIATGIGKGISAAQLSKSLSQYLRDFQALKRDYSEKFGKQTNIKNCEYKAARLARTEINMSYREAEQERWRNEDFVVGYEIKRSGTPYPCPVCENLQGKYPKDFKWNGWHPNCRCYAIPILKTEDEFWADEGDSTESQNEVNGMPENFNNWVKDNGERIKEAGVNNSEPFFVRNNRAIINGILDNNYETELASEFEIKGGGDVNSAKNFGLLEFKRDLFNKLEADGVKTSDIKCSAFFDNFGNWSFSFMGEEFKLTRSFTISELTEVPQTICHHDYFRVADRFQGKGISKYVMRESYKRYKKCGVDIIELDANLESGGLVWSKYGFYASNQRQALRAIRGIPHIEEAKFIVDEYYESVQPNKPFPMYLLVKEGLGKELLGSSWEGVLDLNSKQQVEYFEKYLGIKSQ